METWAQCTGNHISAAFENMVRAHAADSYSVPSCKLVKRRNVIQTIGNISPRPESDNAFQRLVTESAGNGTIPVLFRLGEEDKMQYFIELHLLPPRFFALSPQCYQNHSIPTVSASDREARDSDRQLHYSLGKLVKSLEPHPRLYSLSDTGFIVSKVLEPYSTSSSFWAISNLASSSRHRSPEHRSLSLTSVSAAAIRLQDIRSNNLLYSPLESFGGYLLGEMAVETSANMDTDKAIMENGISEDEYLSLRTNPKYYRCWYGTFDDWYGTIRKNFGEAGFPPEKVEQIVFRLREGFWRIKDFGPDDFLTMMKRVGRETDLKELARVHGKLRLDRPFDLDTRFKLRAADGKSGYYIMYTYQDVVLIDPSPAAADLKKLEALQAGKTEHMIVEGRAAQALQLFRAGIEEKPRPFIPLGALGRCLSEDGPSVVTPFHLLWMMDEKQVWVIADIEFDRDDERKYKYPFRHPKQRIDTLEGVDMRFSVACIDGLWENSFSDGGAIRDLHATGGFSVHDVVRMDGYTQVCPAELLAPYVEPPWVV